MLPVRRPDISDAMTVPAPVAGDVLTDLRTAIASLLARVEAGLDADAGSEISGLSPAQHALARLVAGRDGGHDAHLLGMPVDGARLVVVRAGRSPTAARRVFAAVSAERGMLVTWSPVGEVVALVRNSPRRPGEDRGLAAALRVGELVNRSDADASVGISAAMATAAELPAAYADARDAAGLTDSGSTACADDVWAEITLARVAERLPSLLTLGNPLARLAAHDRRHDSHLSSSVGTWLRTNQDTLTTAEALCVHPNTLRYRLRRAGEISGLDLTDGAQRLAAELIERCVRPT